MTYVSENILDKGNEGIIMHTIKTKVVSRVAVATALSFGIGAGAVGVATASPVAHSALGRDQSQLFVRGTVSSYVPGTSISVLSGDATTPTTYALTATTTITGLATGATLASPDWVFLVLSATTPPTVTSISVKGHGEDTNRGSSNGSWSGRGGKRHGPQHHGGRGFGVSRDGHGRH